MALKIRHFFWVVWEGWFEQIGFNLRWHRHQPCDPILSIDLRDMVHEPPLEPVSPLVGLHEGRVRGQGFELLHEKIHGETDKKQTLDRYKNQTNDTHSVALRYGNRGRCRLLYRRLKHPPKQRIRQHKKRCTTRQRCIHQKIDEVLLISEPHAIVHPWTVVVHSEDAETARLAVVGSRGLPSVFAFPAGAGPRGGPRQWGVVL
mmetsp:Transcript_33355/g.66142  ORF Transcript_33355/g.66142 Transcript_33355/m.66142 type:complete len:203 (+) Transcript_33355:72-680(+)